MMRLAMTYLRDRGAAEDAVQETWLTCLKTLDRFEGRSSLKTWVFGILLNVARSRRRKESRILPFASLFRRDGGNDRGPTVDPHRFGRDGMWSTPPDSWSNVPESRLLDRETVGKVKAAIETLPAKQREVVILRDVAGFEADEVCALLSISQANQRVRLHRGRASVRKMLEEYLK
jgi:RNA polymerase sigma-70 factor (ECF subfamily)